MNKWGIYNNGGRHSPQSQVYGQGAVGVGVPAKASIHGYISMVMYPWLYIHGHVSMVMYPWLYVHGYMSMVMYPW